MNEQIERPKLDMYDSVIKIANTMPDYVSDSDKIKSVVEKMIMSGSRRLPVLDNSKKMVGIISTMDILDALLRNINFDKKVSEIMVRQVVICSPDESADFVLKKLMFSKRGGAPIVKDKKLVGMVNERNFVRVVYGNVFNMTVESVMTKKPFVLKSGTKIIDALKIMVNTHYRRMPIVKGEKMVGIVSSMDMLKHFANTNFTFRNSADPIDSIASQNFFSITKGLDISEAVKLMTEKDVGGLPVLDSDGNLKGIITERDIIENIE